METGSPKIQEQAAGWQLLQELVWQSWSKGWKLRQNFYVAVWRQNFNPFLFGRPQSLLLKPSTDSIRLTHVTESNLLESIKKSTNLKVLLLFSLSVVSTFCDPKDCSPPAPLSMGLPKQEYWSGLPFPSPGIIPVQELNPHLLYLLHWQLDSLPLSHQGSPNLKVNHF